MLIKVANSKNSACAAYDSYNVQSTTLSFDLSLHNSKFNYNLSLRKEITNQTEIPFTGNTGIHYQLTKHIATKINGNKSYRQPTLNDLY